MLVLLDLVVMETASGGQSCISGMWHSRVPRGGQLKQGDWHSPGQFSKKPLHAELFWIWVASIDGGGRWGGSIWGKVWFWDLQLPRLQPFKSPDLLNLKQAACHSLQSSSCSNSVLSQRELGVLFFKLSLSNGADRIGRAHQPVGVFSILLLGTLSLSCSTYSLTKFASGGRFPCRQCGWESQYSLGCDFFQISWITHSPSLPACKKFQISEFSACKGYVFCFGDFPPAVRQSPVPYSSSL
jgi:hypothetical protein